MKISQLVKKNHQQRGDHLKYKSLPGFFCTFCITLPFALFLGNFSLKNHRDF